jgi:hypothetical protein
VLQALPETFAVLVPELEKVARILIAADERRDGAARQIERANRARLRVGYVDDAVGRSEARGLGESAFVERTVCAPLGAVAGDRADLKLLEVETPNLVRPRHRDEHLFAADE